MAIENQYLSAYCRWRREVRTFACWRIESARLLEERFSPHPYIPPRTQPLFYDSDSAYRPAHSHSSQQAEGATSGGCLLWLAVCCLCPVPTCEVPLLTSKPGREHCSASIRTGSSFLSAHETGSCSRRAKRQTPQFELHRPPTVKQVLSRLPPGHHPRNSDRQRQVPSGGRNPITRRPTPCGLPRSPDPARATKANGRPDLRHRWQLRTRPGGPRPPGAAWLGASGELRTRARLGRSAHLARLAYFRDYTLPPTPRTCERTD